MKRLAWLLLAAFSTALAQVQPVELPATKHEACHCCAKAGDCGMPDCAPAPAQPVRTEIPATPVVRVAVKLAAPVPRGFREKFYVQLLPRSVVALGLPAARAVAPTASVPLFREHCSPLI